MGVNTLLVRHAITSSEIDPVDSALNGPPGRGYEVIEAYRYSNGRPKRTAGVLQEYCKSTAKVLQKYVFVIYSELVQLRSCHA
jgi:hypothetical protein